MKIALDAMGSDQGATPLVEGAVMAARRYHCSTILVGREHSLRRLLRVFKYDGKLISIEPCSQVVSMGASPKDSLRLTDSSVAVAARLVKEGKADAMVSAGNSGCTLAHCMKSWRRMKGINRPGIATIIPSPAGKFLLLDVGANVECKPRQLVDWALMGEIYARQVMGVKNPRVGLLNVGEEPGKGNQLVQVTHTMLEASHLHFIGNVEGNTIYQGRADVVVCDGFVGNVVLKTSEGLARMIMKEIKGAMTSNILSLMGALIVSPGMRKFKKQVDYAEYGGAPLLGLNGICIITHGAASPKAVMNAIRAAREAVKNEINEHIAREAQQVSQEIKDIPETMEGAV
ncbi:MAG: phosphate acyltransferase PlsX [Candidatus Sumerlaeota bacterium]